ncbi:MAG: hypothetical protein IJT16_05785 [Lachnospiraceae bacterium]|nr:hypothetical protein [Lachnospiraceae bacterium]
MKTEPEYSPNGAIAELLVTWEYGEGDDGAWLTLRNGVDYKLAYSANKAVGEDEGQVKIYWLTIFVADQPDSQTQFQ